MLDQMPHAKAASGVLERLEVGTDRGFLAWHSISNIYYLMEPYDERGGFHADCAAFWFDSQC